MKAISADHAFIIAVFILFLYLIVDLYLWNKLNTRNEILERIHQLEQIKNTCTKSEGLIDAAYRF